MIWVGIFRIFVSESSVSIFLLKVQQSIISIILPKATPSVLFPLMFCPYGTGDSNPAGKRKK